MALALRVGNQFKDINHQVFERSLLEGSLQNSSARYLAESLQHRLTPVDSITLIYEVVRDRFAGFPGSLPNDDQVPFPTMETRKSAYPIKGPDLPWEWEMDPEWNIPLILNDNQTLLERLQDPRRRNWYPHSLSTATAALFVPGVCDPDARNPQLPTFYENCTEENNDGEGVLSPHPWNLDILRKAKDVAPLLKAIYEFSTDILSISVAFRTGATLTFPHTPVDGRQLYNTTGCAWMTETPHPLNKSRGVIWDAPNCLQPGLTRSIRAKHAMEDGGFCQQQARDPGRFHVSGPRILHDGIKVADYGQAIYDLVTEEFLACITISISLSRMESLLRESSLSQFALIAIVQGEAGTVIASNNPRLQHPTRICEVGHTAGIATECNRRYQRVYNLVDYDLPWDPHEVREKYEFFRSFQDGYYAIVNPFPPVPDEYSPDYRPQFFVVVTFSEQIVKSATDEVNGSVDKRMQQSIVLCVAVGAVGFACSVMILLVMASALTRPLQKMNKVAASILQSFGGSSSTGAMQHISTVKDDTLCMPRTEVTDLTQAFNNMIASFSGSLLTRSAEHSREIELRNCFLNSARAKPPKEFQDLYTQTASDSDVSKASLHTSPNESDSRMDNGRSASFCNDKEDHEEEIIFVDSDEEELQNVAAFAFSDVSDIDEPFAFSVVSNNEQASVRNDARKEPLRIHDDSLNNRAISSPSGNPTEQFDGNAQSTTSWDQEAEIDDPVISADDVSSFSEGGQNNSNDDLSQEHRFRNTGENIVFPSSKAFMKAGSLEESRSEKFDQRFCGMQIPKGIKSPLFLWIVILIVVPLFLTAAVIAAVVLFALHDEFQDSVSDSEEFFVEAEKIMLALTTQLRATLVSGMTSRAMLQLYTLSRYSGWLFFDGLLRSESFPKGLSAVNECKFEESWEVCEWAQVNKVCDCAWNWPSTLSTCKKFEKETLSRYEQMPYYFVSSDAAKEDGSRTDSLYPKTHKHPNETMWWSNVEHLPGALKGGKASEYSTSYDRIRIGLANPLLVALHNSDRNREVATGYYYGFEADGGFLAYEGCSNADHSWAAFWQSTEENGAEGYRPKLCPIGRFGYDPRCRNWYDTGRQRGLISRSLHITPPYVFSGGEMIGQTATSSLIDSANGNFIGQVAIDFTATHIFETLAKTRNILNTGGFVLMITIVSDTLGGDTVFGPGIDGTSPALSSFDVVLPNDVNCSSSLKETCESRIDHFEEILKSMKRGESGTGSFARTTGLGATEEMVIAYFPVFVPFGEPTNASDFRRGALTREECIYSIALVQPMSSILQPYDEVEDEMNRKLSVSIGTLSGMICVVLVASVWVAYKVAESIATPLLYLAGAVKDIAASDQTNLPPSLHLKEGPKELLYISHTIDGLYRAVSVANAFFKAGELEAAYSLLVDALHLFKRLDNRKAIGVALNNLGNILLIMYREMKADGLYHKYGLDMQDVIERAGACFNEAVKLGEALYEEFYTREGWTPNCLDFMQHLSNRYFNRAIFMLSSKGAHVDPDEAERVGLRDLEISGDMDNEVIAYGEEIGWRSSHRSEDAFNFGLVRVRGLVLLIESGYKDTWDIEGKLEDLKELLESEREKPKSQLFAKMNHTGRLQQLETEMMRYALVSGQIEKAATVAIRSCIEDEFILLNTQRQASRALKAFFASTRRAPHRKDLLLDHIKEMSRLIADNYISQKDIAIDEHSQAASDLMGSTGVESKRSIFSRSILLANERLDPETSSMTFASRNSNLPDLISWQIVTMEQF